jgi:DNA-binding response OmpR family regulator
MSELKKVLILLNDPDPFLTRVFQNKFKKSVGWDSIITTNLEEALEKLSVEKPNVILTEIILKDDKGRNGFDFIKIIKENNELKDSYIIVLTDLSQESDKEKALELGANEYMVKSDILITDIIEKLKNKIQ